MLLGLTLRPTGMKEFYRRHLPHWQPPGAVFFVTFRLKNSLPYEIIETLRAERERARIALHKFPESESAYQNAPTSNVILNNGKVILTRQSLARVGCRSQKLPIL
jgi:hypothetical protein